MKFVVVNKRPVKVQIPGTDLEFGRGQTEITSGQKLELEKSKLFKSLVDGGLLIVKQVGKPDPVPVETTDDTSVDTKIVGKKK